MIRIRPLEAYDEPFLPRFLALAAHEEDVATAVTNRGLALYIEGWGWEGDYGVVAEDEKTRTIVGMAWARFWTRKEHGFGWMDELTPELSVAVESEFQGQNVGTRLIEALKYRLCDVESIQQKWVTASYLVEVEQPEMQMPPQRVSLNVREGSPAIRLYERLGFTKVEGSERRNRTGGVSFNMVAPLSQRENRLDTNGHGFL